MWLSISDWLKPGAVVIDVGINDVPDATKKAGYRLVGDANYEECAKVGPAVCSMMCSSMIHEHMA